MAISEGLQQRINNLTGSMASPMGEINSPARPISDKEMEMYMQANPNKPLFGSPSMGNIGGGKGAISDQERQMLRESLGMASNDFGPDATKSLDDAIRATGFFQDADLNALSGEQKLELLQGAQRIQEANQQQLMMARDAIKPMGAQFTEGEAERLSTAAFGDPINETQQAIDSLTQQLQVTTDPDEAEGLGQMIQKLQAQINAPMGAMAQELAKVGGGEDTALAHLRPGEIVLPPEMMEDPRFEKMVEDKFKGLGIDPKQAVVGMGIASLNESTGLEEFGFFKKLGKVLKKVAPLAVLIPGVGTALGGALGGLGGLATKGLAKVGLGGLGSALGSLGSSAMGMVANAGIPGLSSIAGGTAGGFGSIGGGLGSLKGLLGDGPLSGLLGGGQQPSIDELGKADGSTQVRIDRLRSEGMSDAQIMQNLQQSGMAPQASGGTRKLWFRYSQRWNRHDRRHV
jgi:hypothetical protein